MTEDSDAARILRDREQRRVLERAHIDEERHERQVELRRLRLFGLGSQTRPAEETKQAAPPRFLVPSLAPPEGPSPSATVVEENRPTKTDLYWREIGGALRPRALTEFLQTNPMDRFDIQSLNRLRLTGVVEAARGDRDLLSAILRQAEALMDRVKHEVDDPLSAGAFLRDRVLQWYRESPEDPEWTDRMTKGWAGLFAESRVTGGRLEPWINLRLWSLREEAARAGPWRSKLKRGLTRDRRAESCVARTPSQQIRAEVAQAILDDLATSRRDHDAITPLVRLSELAVRRQVPTVNEAMALIFNAPETGPFVLLHPNRYPDCDELQIRSPTAGATGAVLAYSLVPGRAGRKPPGRGRSASAPNVDAPTGASGPTDLDEDDEVDAATVWDADNVGPSTWRRIIKERRKERHRLDPPPKDSHGRPAYRVLRDLVLEDAEVRQAFVSIKWRGRPAGIPLLATLLQKGILAPEVATDHEYLEAELGDLVQGDPQWSPADGSWTTHGWTIVRSGSHQEGFRFTAKRAA
jgi:hypothetical protein